MTKSAGTAELPFVIVFSEIPCASVETGADAKLPMANQATKKLPVSVCLISGAEAGRIGRALESVAGWTSETIVLLNEEVRDGTEEIAIRHGAKVFREPWKGFLAQKKSAAEKTTQPWTLSLDADEEVSPELQDEIQQTLADPGRFVAFEFPRCTLYCGRWIRHGDWYPDRVRRLWKKDCGNWAGIDPHPYIEVRGKLGRLRSDLRHFSNESIDHMIAKIPPYSSDFVRHQLARGRATSVLDLAFRPAWRFFRAYILRLGFLDGWQGYYIAWMNAFSAVTRYTKVLEAHAVQQLSKP